MGWIIYRRYNKAQGIFKGKAYRQQQHRRLGYIWEVDVKINCKEMAVSNVGLFELDQVWIQ
jgi:hypothetical protein